MTMNCTVDEDCVQTSEEGGGRGEGEGGKEQTLS